ncbi:tape measure protein [Pueribacillus sp. YX66]|uniref:tape measure protein n=1 Tax=Pueribacillus sp. YX66 TaxID=3229242 RepID=UPI00358D22EB
MADGSVKIEVILDDSKVGGNIKKVEGRLSGIGSTAKRGLATVGKLAGALGLVGLAYKGIDMVKRSLDGAIDRYDTLNNFPRVMQQIGFDANDSQRAIDKLSDGIQGLPTRLDEVASTAQNIAIMTGDLEGAVDTTLALNNAFLASGASAQDAQRGLDQYVQMLAKGEVDLQSWRTLQETMPFALRETAEAFGFTGESATNDFYEALKSGEITMSEFNDKLIELDQAQGGFAETAQTASGGIKTAWTNMKTWVVMGVADIIAAIDDALGGTGSLEGAINSLKPVVQGVFGWIANTAIPAVASAVRWVRERFDELKPVFERVKDAAKPLIDTFMETRDVLISQLTPIWEDLKGLLESLFPILQTLGMIIGGAVVAAIVVWSSVLSGVVRAVGPIINAFINLIDVVVNVVNAIVAIFKGDFQGALDFWNAATESAVDFFKNLWDGIVGFVQGIVETVIGWFEFLYDILVGNSIIPDMVNAIIEWFGNLLSRAVEKVTELVASVVKYFAEMKDKAIERATQLYHNARDRFEQLKQAIIDRITQAKNDLIRRFTEMVINAKNKASEIVTTARQKFEEVKQAIQNKLSEAVRVVSQKIGEMPGKVTEKVGDMLSAGKDLIRGLINGIKNMGASAIEAVAGVVDGVINKAKSMLKISSPSKLFEQFGEWTSEGLSIGIDKGSKDAIKSMDKLVDNLSREIQPEFIGLRKLQGLSANSFLGGVLPISAVSSSGGGIVNRTQTTRQVIQIEAGDIYMDGRKVGQVIWKPIKEEIDRDERVKRAFRR